ncbi:right-handed parallel beta-helix repeat-containing protein, partial [bacterium]|nr:right-handed parallel beta-helix repeat-containing protein [bacterium]
GGGIELFFQDRPMTLARWPNDGFIRITGLAEPGTVNVRGTKGSKAGKFMYDGDRPRRWAGEKDPWVHGYWFWDWSDQRHPVESIDTAKHIIAVKPPYHSYGYRVGQWFYGLNLLSEIDQPGEWYLDRQAGLLYFWPPASVKTGRAVVSVIPTLVTMKDASHVSLGGMVLENCRGTAVSASGGTHVAIQAYTMRNLGGYAVRISGATDSGVFGCDIYGTGEGGISLSGGDRKTLTPARLVADNNHIHHYGRWNRMYKAGIHLSGVGNRASHNLIHNAPHMAISFGGNEHVIEFNEIHSVCHESNDAGAMYAGRNWTMRGTVVRHNYLHHINGFEGRGCVGVYLDDMFCGTTITGNVFYKVTRAAFIGGGRDCSVTNNIFVDCPRALHIDGRALGWAKGHSEGWVKEGREKRTHLGIKFLEPPYSTRYPPLKTVLDDEPFAPKGNVVARNIFVGKQWNDINHQAKKYVTLKDNLIDEDPHFVAAPPKSFVLKDDSPAYKLGFQRIPVGKIGLVNDGQRASWPVTHAVRPMVEAKVKPRVPKGKAPVFRVPRTKGALHADGADPKKAMLLQQGVQGQKTKPISRAWLGHDGTTLFVAIDNAVAPKPALKRNSVWGQNDAMELAFQNPALGKAAPILILRGYPNGKWESSDEADAPAAAVKKAAEGVQFAAKVASPTRWTAEWAIPLASLGIDPAKHPKIRFNLTVRKTAQDLWLMWEGTRGYSWQVEQAGILEWEK